MEELQLEAEAEAAAESNAPPLLSKLPPIPKALYSQTHDFLRSTKPVPPSTCSIPPPPPGPWSSPPRASLSLSTIHYSPIIHGPRDFLRIPLVQFADDPFIHLPLLLPLAPRIFPSSQCQSHSQHLAPFPPSLAP